jgi:hypothetical protein
MSHEKYRPVIATGPPVKRFRVSPFWIKTFIYILTIVFLGAGRRHHRERLPLARQRDLRLEEPGAERPLNQAQIPL